MTKIRRFLSRDSVKGALAILGVIGGALAAASAPGPWYSRVGAALAAAVGGFAVISGGTSGLQPPAP